MMIHQIVDKRYRIIKPISSNILGQTYLAGDTRRPGSPQCLVREIQLNNFQPENREIILSLFRQKVEKIDSLSKHDKLPNLLAYFHEEDNIYLVEDYILGLSIAEQLAIGKPLLEIEVINILEEVLEILLFIHDRGEIHGQITPSNLIKRASDQKLVLIRFGLEREIKTILELEKQSSKSNKSNEKTSDSSLYISWEQSQGNLHPNIDIYALGMIAIRALTGLSIQDLLQQKQTNQSSDLGMAWDNLLVCSPKLVDIIHKMVNTEIKQGYQSVSEVLTELSNLEMSTQNKISSEPAEIIISEAEETELFSPLQFTKNGVVQILNDETKQEDIGKEKDAGWWCNRNGKGSTGSLKSRGDFLGHAPQTRISPTGVGKKLKNIYPYHDHAELPNSQENNNKSPDRQQQKKIKFALVGLLATAVIAGLVTTYLWQRQFTSRVQALYNQAQQLAKQGQQQKAIALYTEAINLSPQNARIYYQRGNSYYGQRAYEKAIKDYTKAIQIKSNYNDAYYNRALSYYELDNYVKAISDFTQTLRLNPDDAQAYDKRGLIYYKIGDYKNSIRDYSQSIRLNPKNTEVYINRGIARGAIGDRAGAISDYTQALKINPNDPQAYYHRGRARFYLADDPGAVEDYTQALELKTDYPDAHTNRCSSYLNLRKYQAAIKDCTQAIELNPKDIAAYNNRCVGYLNVGEYQKAAEDCSIAIDINPENAKGYNNRALARSASGDLQEAIQDFTTAIKINSKDSVAYSNRGMIYLEIGNYNNAIEDFAQAIKLNPGNATAYYNRGVVLSQLQNIVEAVEDFSKSANLFLEQGRAEDYQNAQNMIEKLKY